MLKSYHKDSQLPVTRILVEMSLSADKKLINCMCKKANSIEIKILICFKNYKKITSNQYSKKIENYRAEKYVEQTS